MEGPVLSAISQNCGFDNPRHPKDPDDLCVALTKVLTEKFPDIMEELESVFVANVWVHDREAYPCVVLCDSWITGSRKPTTE